MEQVVKLTPKERKALRAWADAQRKAKLAEVKAKALREAALELPKLAGIVEAAKADVEHCGSYHLEDLARLTLSSGMKTTAEIEEITNLLKRQKQLSTVITHKGYSVSKAVLEKLPEKDQKRVWEIAEEQFRAATLYTK